MKPFGRSLSHPWWWNSHSSPKNSKWLQLSLQELDEKVKEMWVLIEEDADSFAEKAEMYYKKRPQLLQLLGELHRAYRSLAERYDHLAGEVRQNGPKALQSRFSFSGDSSRKAAYEEQHHSSLRKTDECFVGLIDKAGEAEVMVSQHKMKMVEHTPIEHGEMDNMIVGPCDVNGNDEDSAHDSKTKYDSHSKTVASDIEGEDSPSGVKLQQEIMDFEEENDLLTCPEREILKSKYDSRQEGESQGDQRINSPSNITEKYAAFCQERGIKATTFMGDLDDTVRDGNVKKDHDITTCIKRINMDSYPINHQKQCQDSLNCENQVYTATVQKELNLLIEENKALRQTILEREEEKRHAIRQLCLSMDILKHENERLISFISKDRRDSVCSYIKLPCMGN
ncbi:hypothetical protein KP509_05G014900 [Ceratopteris richardii]|nr:hypothetical protein KP509_05G014900 [Ceratopteris richardii]